jgi:serine/threonine protein kinase
VLCPEWHNPYVHLNKRNVSLSIVTGRARFFINRFFICGGLEMLFKPGFLVRGRYLILRQITQSSTGVMYEAIDKRLRKRVVLKQLYAPHQRNGAMCKIFAQEATLLMELSHTALPCTLDYFVESAGQFLVMEFIAGDSLWAILKQRRYQPFLLGDVLNWADQLLDALHYLHTRPEPIIHRDIKPQNLKKSHNGNIMLLDIGLARNTGNPTLPDHDGYSYSMLPEASLDQNAARDTPAVSTQNPVLHYMPPEQVQGVIDEPRSDIYALGASLYVLLSGYLPPNALERALALSLGYPDPLRPLYELNTQVPTDVAAVVEQAMSYAPQQRFDSPATMQQALADTWNTRVRTVAR